MPSSSIIYYLAPLLVPFVPEGCAEYLIVDGPGFAADGAAWIFAGRTLTPECPP